MRISLEEVRRLCNKILVSRGLDEDEANIIVEDYLDAELRGKVSHGLAAFGVVANDVLHRGKFELIYDDGVVAQFDGKGDIGHLVAHEALKHATRTCERLGVSVIGIKNIRRFATPGSIAKKAAQSGLISIVLEYGGQAFMAPYGSADPVISTNPIGIGIPTPRQPLLLDMASSVKAFYFIDLAKKLGKTIPPAWAIDDKGNPTTDPSSAKAVAPFGGYKGYALAFMLEILTGIFVGVEVGLEGAISKRGALLLFFKPDLFKVPIETFHEKVQVLVNEVKESRHAPNIQEILVPGEQGESRRTTILKSGSIDIDDRIYSDLTKLLNV